MSRYLHKLFIDRILDDLSEKEKVMYKSVIEMEDEIADKVKTSEQFIDRLKIGSPHKELAEHFDMTLSEFINATNEIEEVISKKLEDMYARIQWFDYTYKLGTRIGGKKKVFFVTMP
ncbi:hypothetical protein [Aquibacillus rhizosphaerae]|uniref:Uncharacterized protein n=1 Tax=Aquibacillus rhizosphaerae TaxID=3051431 RepID=A0ABT7L3S9_9BACI|nr:hypothetical protein [Aquibacillus sp. LR5S19]MDL4839857.1 hypothetical protein [Aquibacillus sp. LR5S19]